MPATHLFTTNTQCIKHCMLLLLLSLESPQSRPHGHTPRKPPVEAALLKSPRLIWAFKLRLAGRGLCVATCYGGKSAWLAGCGHCMANNWAQRAERVDWGLSSISQFTKLRAINVDEHMPTNLLSLATVHTHHDIV